MLKAETSTLLNDGDIITFGKTVGRGDEWVKPVVALVQLLYAPPPFKALTVPSPSCSEKSRSSSGRYGIHDSISSDDSNSNLSDIEEVTRAQSSPIEEPSEQQATSAVSSDLKQVEQSRESAMPAYDAFKRFISPAIGRLPSVSEIIGDKCVGLLDEASKSLLSLPFPATIRRLDDENASSSDPRRPDLLESRSESRSSSPMDLGSPESPTEVQASISRKLSTPLPSPIIGSLDTPFFDEPPFMGTSSIPGFSGPNNSLPPVSTSQGSMYNMNLSAPVPPPHPAQNVTPSGITENATSAELQWTLKELEASVNKLRGSHRKYKSSANGNVIVLSNKLSEIDDKFAEVDAEYNVLCDQVEELQHGDLPDLARQIENLNERVDAIIADRDEVKKTLDAGSPEAMQVEDVKISVTSLNELAQEMQLFFLKSQEELKTAREEAMETIEGVKAILADLERGTQVCPSPIIVSTNDFNQAFDNCHHHQAPVLMSLKRKRDDADEDEDAKSEIGIPVILADEPVIGVATEESNVDDIEMVADVNHEDSTTDVELPPRKRLRTVGSVVAHTATAVALGGFITWSALAFS